jgi:hypothetical protein
VLRGLAHAVGRAACTLMCACISGKVRGSGTGRVSCEREVVGGALGGLFGVCDGGFVKADIASTQLGCQTVPGVLECVVLESGSIQGLPLCCCVPKPQPC